MNHKAQYSISLTIVLALMLNFNISEVNAQHTDASMFWKKTGEYISYVESETGDLYKALGHHGPAVENQWVGYRIYFNNSMSVDVLSKFEPRLELKTAKWYGNDMLFSLNYGKDNVKVGKTVGIGGLRLWYNDSVKYFETKSIRTGKISETDSTACIEITSFGVPYEDQLIDIEIRMTVFSGCRYACIEAEVVSGVKVRFVTGLVTHGGLKKEKSKNTMVTWGDYDSPAASEAFDVGAAIIYNSKDFTTFFEEEEQRLCISKPTNYLKYYISSSNEKEMSDLNTFSAFKEHVNKLAIEMFE